MAAEQVTNNAIYIYIYIYIYFLQCMNFVHFVSRVLVRLGTSPIRLVL